jgi:hypothetical protein
MSILVTSSAGFIGSHFVLNWLCRSYAPLIGIQLPILGIGIYTTFVHNKNNGLQQNKASSPAGEGWGEESKIKYLNPPSSQPSPSREKEHPLV